MLTVHIFIGTKPGIVKNETGTIIFDPNNAGRDKAITVESPMEADERQEACVSLGLASKRYYMKNGNLVKDKVEELLDEEGNQILDYWASSADFIAPLAQTDNPMADEFESIMQEANILAARVATMKAGIKHA